jgi:hypothetical protein
MRITLQIISYSNRRTAESGNKAETKWKFSGNVFPPYFLSLWAI